MNKRIEITEIGSGEYTVRVDNLFADHLTRDEVLGVVASALFSEKIMYVKTYEQWVYWQERYCGLDRTNQKLISQTSGYTVCSD